MILLFSIIGGVISRMDGKDGNPWNFLFCLPYAGIAFYALTLPDSAFLQFPWLVWLFTAFAYVGAVAGKVTSHGGWIDMGTWTKERREMKLEFLIKWLRGKINEYWYDYIGNVLTGVLVSLLCSIVVLVAGHTSAALVLLAGGLAKGTAYQIGWAVQKSILHKMPEEIDEQTEIAEFLTGAFSYASIYATFIILN